MLRPCLARRTFSAGPCISVTHNRQLRLLKWIVSGYSFDRGLWLVEAELTWVRAYCEPSFFVCLWCLQNCLLFGVFCFHVQDLYCALSSVLPHAKSSLWWLKIRKLLNSWGEYYTIFRLRLEDGMRWTNTWKG